MALLELLHKYCAWNCPNEGNGCDYIFTGNDRTEYWIHVENCPFRKTVEQVLSNVGKIDTETFDVRNKEASGQGNEWNRICQDQNLGKLKVKASKEVENEGIYSSSEMKGEKANEVHEKQFEVPGVRFQQRSQNRDQYNDSVRHELFPSPANVQDRGQVTPRGHVSRAVRDLFRM